MIAFIEAYKAGLMSRRNWANNIVAGVVVGIVALPLGMAFAIASGANPEQGIYTSIIAGFFAAVCGGSRFQISGPTGAFIAILAGITAQYGIVGLQVATLMAGVILVLMGALRFGSVIKYIPDPVIVGFTTGIGVIIWVGQWKDFFGLKPGLGGIMQPEVAAHLKSGIAEGLKSDAVIGLRPDAVELETILKVKPAAPTAHFHEKFIELVSAFPTIHWPTVTLALLSLLILIVGPRYLKRVPAPLVAMVAATLAHVLLVNLGSAPFAEVATIGSTFSGGIPRALPQFSLPSFTFSDLVTLIGPAFTIALLGAIESLLSAVVADGMTGSRHSSNQELIGQGIANIAAPLFGGFAATGAIARTATNIRNGATGPLAGIVHSITLLIIILALAPLASYIPLCSLAAILFVVAYNMSELKHFIHLARTAPKSDVVILLITFGLTVFADLVIAVNVGIMLASLLFMRNMAKSVQVEVQQGGGERTGESSPIAVPDNMLVYNINGPFFFGAAEKLERTLININAKMDTVVLRMLRVPFIDATGIQALDELIANFRKEGTTVVVCELNPNVRSKLGRAGVIRKLGSMNIYPTLEEFLLQHSLSKQDAADGESTLGDEQTVDAR